MSSDSCLNGERQGSQCYAKCDSGFIGFGPFCLRDRAQFEQAGGQSIVPSADRQSYRRQKADSAYGDDGYICPSAVPYNCAIFFCAKDFDTCFNSAGDLLALMLKITVDYNDGHFIQAFFGLIKLYAKTLFIPICDSSKNITSKEMVAHIFAYYLNNAKQ